MAFEQRLDAYAVDPAAFKAIYGMEKYVQDSGLDPHLYELVKIRASQLNGCAYCLDMHTRDARAKGEEQRRLDILSAWREAPGFFTEAERAALALTESVTLIGQAGVPDHVWDEAARQFADDDLVHLLMAISVINVWNRMAVSVHQDLPET